MRVQIPPIPLQQRGSALHADGPATAAGLDDMTERQGQRLQSACSQVRLLVSSSTRGRLASKAGVAGCNPDVYGHAWFDSRVSHCRIAKSLAWAHNPRHPGALPGPAPSSLDPAVRMPPCLGGRAGSNPAGSASARVAEWLGAWLPPRSRRFDPCLSLAK